MATIDLFTYNGEEDLLEIRLNTLDSYVDEFIICEARSTFSRFEKPMHWEAQKERFKKWWPKIKYFIIEDNYSYEQVIDAYNSKYTDKQPRWMHEFLQKEEIKYAIEHLKDDDLVYVGDVDEIWEPVPHVGGIQKLKLWVYAYHLNLLSSEEFWGPIRAFYKDIKGQCLNDLRNNVDYRTQDYQGVHLTSQGGVEAVKKKVFDQYTSANYYGVSIIDLVEKNYGKGDYLGRNFTFKVDESHWPEWLVINREKFAYLLK